MDSLNKAQDLLQLKKALTWQILSAKGVDKEGKKTCFSQFRKLEMKSTTTGVHNSKSPHPLTFNLSAQIPDGLYAAIHLNNPAFLHALAEAITDKLPDLLDDALAIIDREQKKAFQEAEEGLAQIHKRLESLRPELKEQRELL